MVGLGTVILDILASVRAVWRSLRLWSLAHYRFTGGEVTRKGLIYRHLPAWNYMSVVDGPASDS